MVIIFSEYAFYVSRICFLYLLNMLTIFVTYALYIMCRICFLYLPYTPSIFPAPGPEFYGFHNYLCACVCVRACVCVFVFVCAYSFAQPRVLSSRSATRCSSNGFFKCTQYTLITYILGEEGALLTLSCDEAKGGMSGLL